MQNGEAPRTLLEATRYFSDPDVCVAFVASLRWPDSPVCPSCEGTEHSYLTPRRIWKCKACKRQFSVKVGTIFEDSPIGFDKWLPAIWLIANSKNGISSHELGRAIGLTQKSAWFVLHRIRLAMQYGFDKFSGEIEVDETFVGGLGRNMHKSVKLKRQITTGGASKTAVMGFKQRGGDVRVLMPDNLKKATLHRHVHEEVAAGATIYTDANYSYTGLGQWFDHGVVDHAQSYVNGRVHTNGLENFWSLLKRGLKGTYVAVAPAHLFHYLDERVFTYNKRKLSDFDRFLTVLGQTAGRRLTYDALTGKRLQVDGLF